MRSRALLACAAVGLLAVAAGTAQPGGGWPQYLGPSRDGTAAPFTMPANGVCNTKKSKLSRRSTPATLSRYAP